MFIVGINVVLGGGNWGLSPLPAATDNCATSPHAISVNATTANKEYFGCMSIEFEYNTIKRLVLTTRHFPATFCASSTSLDAFIHTANFLAIHRACAANFSADFTNTTVKRRATELEISRCLADLGTVHHEAKVFYFNMLSTRLKTVVHGGLQADLVAMITCFYAILHRLFLVG
jgi:hypothetical protein